MVKIAPSILSADFTKLGSDISEVYEAGAEYLHIDVMDGLFVPNISIGIPVVKSIRKFTDMFLDVHLMIEKPVRYVKQFCAAGADLVNFHVESDSEEGIKEAIAIARSLNVKTGITIKPATSAEHVLPYITSVDLILIMTVEPGFGGQSFMSDQLPKIEQVCEYIKQYNPSCELEVDGGINAENAPSVISAGGNVLVAGSSVFGKTDRAKAIKGLRG